MNEARKVRSAGEEFGSYPLDKLYRDVTRGCVDSPVEFWSDKKNQWLPLAGIMFDIYPARVAQMREAGISKVSILGTGSDDCPACAALQKKLYSIDDVPALPPPGCSCVPWCRLGSVFKPKGTA